MAEAVSPRLRAMTDVTPGHGPRGDCHVFTGTKPTGYGTISVDGEMRLAHRVAWELAYGAIPPGLWVLHRCDHPPCVRVDHLFLGTRADNTADMVAKGRGRGGRQLGEANPAAKLTREQVDEIRRGGVGRHLAERFGVSESTVSMIRSGKRWAA